MEESGEAKREVAEPVAEPECHSVYGMLLCVGDYVEVYPRSRSLAFFRGRVKRITISSVILENTENDVMIRFSEIKLIRKLKPVKPPSKP